jgi:hypothetical protein
MDIRWFNKTWVTISIVGAFSLCDVYADDSIQPYAIGGLTYSNNIDQNQDDTSAFVFDIGAGIDFDLKTVKNSLSGNYEIRQFIYSDDENKNSAYQNFDLAWLYSTNLDGVSLYSNATVDNIAEFNDENALTDVLAGNTVQSIDVTVGANYVNPIRGTAFVDSTVYYTVTENSDKVGNNVGHGLSFLSTDGLDADVLFWQSDWSYDSRTGRESGLESEYVVFRQSIGIRSPWDVSPLVRVNYEDITGEQGGNVESLYYGAGIRYQYNRFNFLELSYNIADDDNNEDYWGGVLNLQASSNTSLYASYDKRFFGDAYSVAFSHRSKRVTNTLTYDEDPVNYDRSSFVSTSTPSEILLSRQTRWQIDVNGRRSNFNVYVSYRENESVEALLLELDEMDASLGYGAELTHQLSRRTRTALSIDFDDYDFFETDQSDDNQEDFYQRYEANVYHQISRSISSDFGLKYTKRTSDVGIYNYDEIRAIASLRMDF